MYFSIVSRHPPLQIHQPKPLNNKYSECVEVKIRKIQVRVWSKENSETGNCKTRGYQIY